MLATPRPDFRRRAQNRLLPKLLSKTHRVAMGRRFAATFALINESVGEDAFRRYESRTKLFKGPFLISAFEALASGVWHNHDKWMKAKAPARKLLGLVKKMWDTKEFSESKGIGKAAKSRIPKTVSFGKKFFVP